MLNISNNSFIHNKSLFKKNGSNLKYAIYSISEKDIKIYHISRNSIIHSDTEQLIVDKLELLNFLSNLSGP